MREAVCIVLNEREQLKAKYAESVSQQLSALNITASRIEVTAKIEACVVERNPQVLVIDYLLGDYSTGLDVVAALRRIPEHSRPRVIFFTDEPSVQVAVEAMRSGAVDFIEMESSNCVARLIKRIQECLLSSLHNTIPDLISSSPTFSDLIAHAPKSARFKKSLEQEAEQPKPICILSGTSGSGLSAWGEALLNRTSAHTKETIDLRTYSEAFEGLLGSGGRNISGLRLGHNLALLIDHAEEDDGELFQIIAKHHELFWPKSGRAQVRAPLILLFNSAQACQAWQKFPFVARYDLANLSERLEDIPLLAQHFVLHARQELHKKIKALDSEDSAWLATLEWPGQVRELRAVVTYAAMNMDGKFREQIMQAREIWAEQNLHSCNPNISKLSAALALDRYDHRLRRTAAGIGISKLELEQILSDHPMVDNSARKNE